MSDLLEQIKALIDAATGDIDRIEHTLTDGYAQAMALEAERWRLERRISKVAGEMESGDVAAKARELAVLAARLEEIAVDLHRLRSRLAELRQLAGEARVADTAISV